MKKAPDKQGKPDLQFLKNKWPSEIVARSAVREFTGGLIKPRSLANLDCLGEGPPISYYGRRAFYKVDDLICWMEQRARAADK